MTTDNETSAIEGTEPSQNDSQAEKTYSQKEVDDMMAKTKSAVMKKVSSKYEDLGDPDELRNIVSQYQKTQQEQQLKRGEFDKIIQDLAQRKDAEIQKRDKIIESFKLETPIIDAAARYKAVNPDQVKALIRNNLRLNQDGEVEVLDDKGSVRYDDSGRPVSVDSFVQTWLQSNPHFVSATPSTTNTRSNINGSSSTKLDINSLDMKNPEHRRLYAETRKSQ
jgi:hypothetical protein